MTHRPPPGITPKLVIFDCDGVLVDSEPLTTSAMQHVLGRYGLWLEPDELRTRLHGVSPNLLQDVALALWDLSLPDDIVGQVEEAERIAVEDGLLAVSGVPDAVRSVVASGTAVCVGSNGSSNQIEQRLKLTGLHHWFEGRLFSAAMVAQGKPHPDVFLHAARTMGFSPSDCVVIEDSDSGVQAGLSAGMRVLAYVASPTCNVADSREVERFTEMASLPGLLGIDARERST